MASSPAFQSPGPCKTAVLVGFYTPRGIGKVHSANKLLFIALACGRSACCCHIGQVSSLPMRALVSEMLPVGKSANEKNDFWGVTQASVHRWNGWFQTLFRRWSVYTCLEVIRDFSLALPSVPLPIGLIISPYSFKSLLPLTRFTTSITRFLSSASRPITTSPLPTYPQLSLIISPQPPQLCHWCQPCPRIYQHHTNVPRRLLLHYPMCMQCPPETEL